MIGAIVLVMLLSTPNQMVPTPIEDVTLYSRGEPTVVEPWWYTDWLAADPCKDATACLTVGIVTCIQDEQNVNHGGLKKMTWDSTSTEPCTFTCNDSKVYTVRCEVVKPPAKPLPDPDPPKDPPKDPPPLEEGGQ